VTCLHEASFDRRWVNEQRKSSERDRAIGTQDGPQPVSSRSFEWLGCRLEEPLDDRECALSVSDPGEHEAGAIEHNTETVWSFWCSHHKPEWCNLVDDERGEPTSDRAPKVGVVDDKT